MNMCNVRSIAAARTLSALRQQPKPDGDGHSAAIVLCAIATFGISQSFPGAPRVQDSMTNAAGFVMACAMFS